LTEYLYFKKKSLKRENVMGRYPGLGVDIPQGETRLRDITSRGEPVEG
jgi:hypothetical protein